MQQALTRYPGELHGILGHIFPCYTKGSFSAAVTRGASAARAGICSSPRPARTSQQQIKKQHSSDVRVRCEAHVLPGAAPRRELCEEVLRRHGGDGCAVPALPPSSPTSRGAPAVPPAAQSGLRAAHEETRGKCRKSSPETQREADGHI